MTLKEQILYRAKAVAAACGAVLQTAVLALIVDPATEHEIVKVIPAPYQVLASLLLGAIITGVVHKVPNSRAAVVEPPTDTTMLRLTSMNSGEFTGTPAH